MAGKRHTAYCTSKTVNEAGDFGVPAFGVPAFGVPSGYGPARTHGKCAHPECQHPKNSDRSISLHYCCEKCEARANGDEWGMAGKRHTAYCSSKVGGGDPGYDPGNDVGYGVPIGNYGPTGGSQQKCAHPECEYCVNSDSSIVLNYCCEKCEGLHQGADWAEGGKRHYKSCEKIECTGGGGGGGGGFGKGKGDGFGFKGAAPKGGGWMMAPQQPAMPPAMSGKGWGKGFKATQGPSMAHAMPLPGKGWGKDFGQDSGMGWGNPIGKDSFKGSGKDFGKGLKGQRKGIAAAPSLDDHPSENKVWIGNLEQGLDLEEVETYFSLTGGRVLFAALMKGNAGGVAYASADEATEAIALLNGSHFGGSEIQVGVWTGN